MKREVRQLLALSLKRCNTCHRIHHLDEFHAATHGAGGVCSTCKACACEKRRANYVVAAPVQREKVRAWAAANRERKAATNKAWRERNKERCLANGRRSDRKRRETPAGKLAHRVSVNVRQCLLRQGRTKGGRTFEALGYTPAELMAHLERQFLPRMGWHNMGEWHIDHIVPLSSFELDSTESGAFQRAWALPNLRPMWGVENMRKHAKRVTLL
jgi:hypothetical protein